MTFTDALLKVFSWAATVIGFIGAISILALVFVPYYGIWLLMWSSFVILGLIGGAYLYWENMR
jgi:hypothetical protein